MAIFLSTSVGHSSKNYDKFLVTIGVGRRTTRGATARGFLIGTRIGATEVIGLTLVGGTDLGMTSNLWLLIKLTKMSNMCHLY